MILQIGLALLGLAALGSDSNTHSEERKTDNKEGIELNQLLDQQFIGQQNVKQYVKNLAAVVEMEKERKARNMKTSERSYHMVFKGNPGTGKTEIARVMAAIFYEAGIIKEPKLVEASRSDLVAEYIGQTAIKTEKKIKDALGGVLFIDEAYSLFRKDDEKDFGKEAVDALLKNMEDNRNNLIVILAGYGKEMEDFLSMNPGLKSRFPNIIEFDDYSPVELCQIAEKFYNEKGYKIDDLAREVLMEIFENEMNEPYFGNGREARNIVEKSIMNQAARLAASGKNLSEFSDEEICSIVIDDLL